MAEVINWVSKPKTVADWLDHGTDTDMVAMGALLTRRHSHGSNWLALVLVPHYLCSRGRLAGYPEYFLNEASGGSINCDKKWANAPVVWNEDTQSFEVTGAYINVAALVGTLAVTAVLAFDVINVFVVTKVIDVLMFIFAGIKFANRADIRQFIPD
ncbi:hypothetical protein BJ742DRAFT_781403 [Cladochytrium replicatum]|nr:hypothetical protein BJ742DRAFT_781403 [Cladochytrium replicatum]